MVSFETPFDCAYFLYESNQVSKVSSELAAIVLIDNIIIMKGNNNDL